MNNLFREASEAGETPYEGEKSKHWRKTSLIDEGLTTPGTAFTSPWIGTNKSPDKYFVNTVIHPALPEVNAKRFSDSTSISVLSQSMSPTEKFDFWFSSTPAGLSRSLTSRLNTSDSLAGDQSQLSNQNTRDTLIDSTTTGPFTQDLFEGSFVEGESHLPVEHMDQSSGALDLPNVNQSKSSTSEAGTRDPFFDRVPKGPRLSHWNAQAPAFNPWKATEGQGPASPWCNVETSDSPGKRPKGSLLRSRV